MRNAKCCICGDRINNNCSEMNIYSCDITPHLRAIYLKQIFREYPVICSDCATDISNYIDTMKKTARIKLST